MKTTLVATLILAACLAWIPSAQASKIAVLPADYCVGRVSQQSGSYLADSDSLSDCAVDLSALTSGSSYVLTFKFDSDRGPYSESLRIYPAFYRDRSVDHAIFAPPRPNLTGLVGQMWPEVDWALRRCGFVATTRLCGNTSITTPEEASKAWKTLAWADWIERLGVTAVSNLPEARLASCWLLLRNNQARTLVAHSIAGAPRELTACPDDPQLLAEARRAAVESERALRESLLSEYTSSSAGSLEAEAANVVALRAFDHLLADQTFAQTDDGRTLRDMRQFAVAYSQYRGLETKIMNASAYTSSAMVAP